MHLKRFGFGSLVGFFAVLSAVVTGCAAPVDDDLLFFAEGEVRVADLNGETLTYQVVDGFAVLGGDMILGEVEEFEARIASLNASSHEDGVGTFASVVFTPRADWGETIRFRFGDDLTPANRATIRVAMDRLVAESCVNLRFEECTDRSCLLRSHLHFRRGPACMSMVGRAPAPIPNTILLTNGCALNERIVMHEIMHALGFWHEQNRCDRDEFVTLRPENLNPDPIPAVCQVFFDVNIAPSFCMFHDDIGDYDFESIMHYRAGVCAIPGTLVIDSGDPVNNALMGTATGLSDTDAAALRRIYGGACDDGPGDTSGTGVELSCNERQCQEECGGPGMGTCTGNVCSCF